jgi:hypothetical protein
MTCPLFTVFDEKYYPWFVTLARSLRIFEPNMQIVAIAIDVPPHILRNISHEIGNVYFITRHLNTSVQGIARGTIIANSRPFWLMEVIDELRINSLIFADADLLVRGSLHELIALAKNTRAAFIRRPGIVHNRVYRRLRTAAGLFTVSKSGFWLIEQWCERLNKPIPIDDVIPNAWFWEQVCLWETIEPHLISLGTINHQKYLSVPPFDSTALIWAANVKEPSKDLVFAEFASELERLLKC